VRTPNKKLYLYPLKEKYLIEAGTPTMELIRGHKALGDEVRLKILYQLVNRASSLQDLSTQFNISKTTLHHQLSLLKAAKFIQVDKGVYSANPTQINSFSERLAQYLGNPK
jgi:DNA-binding HxlR family transcriptional regulator